MGKSGGFFYPLFGCVDIDIECKNISMSFDIGGVILSTKESESEILKRFCASLSPTANRKQSLSKQNVAVLIKNALKTFFKNTR